MTKTYTGKQCQVTVIAHSINSVTEQKIQTFQLKYPRYIHSEFMTHRMFSRNASSSRAIPAAKLIKNLRENPAFFVHIGSNQPGMQAGAEVSFAMQDQFTQEWVELANIVADYQERWANQYGIHKQVVNRVSEPFQYINVVLTATDLDNFFALRVHKDAQPEIQELANLMKAAITDNYPRVIIPGNAADPKTWHLPYVSSTEMSEYPIEMLVKISSARCARVSYLNHDSTMNTYAENAKLHDTLATSEPMHASPMEHSAHAVEYPVSSRNFNGGWIQYRSILETYGLNRLDNECYKTMPTIPSSNSDE